MQKIFRDSGLIERYGSGVKRAIEEIKGYGLVEPLIEESSGGFRFTILSKEFTENIRQKTTQKTVEKTVEKIVEKIIKLISENPRITQNELAQETGLGRRGIEWNINALKEKGLIKRIGSDRGGYWSVVEK